MTPQRLGVPQLAALVGVAALLLVVVVVLPAALAFEVPVQASDSRTVTGTVRRVLEERTESSPVGEVLVRSLEVVTEDRIVLVQQQLASRGERELAAEPGERVLLSASVGPGGSESYFIVDRVRRSLLIALAGMFALLVVAVGGWQGARSLVGLAVSFLVILKFVIPGVLAGYSPVVVASVGSLAVMAATLTLSRGASARSGAAFVGTAFALLLTVLLASGTFEAARFGGLSEEDINTAGALFGNLDPRGLLLAGVVIGALGVLDDVTMAQASTVWELRRANAALGGRELFFRGMVVGRDHIASTVNTLVLAYAGASLPLLLILVTATEPLGTLANREVLALEIVRALVGSIGIVAAVPFTTAVAAFVATRSEVAAAAPQAAR